MSAPTTASLSHSRPRARRGGHGGHSLPVHSGRFTAAHAERLLWRAGFGPKPGQARKLAQLGLKGAVLSLTRPRSHALVGPKPVLQNGQPIAPYDVWGNDVLWWLDRMVRSNAPLIERMTLIWHDWFATSNEGVNSQRLMIAQYRTQRALSLSSFPRMLSAMTTDPAMLLWLSGAGSTKEAPNENYAREMQELFTLGAGPVFTEDPRLHWHPKAAPLAQLHSEGKVGVMPAVGYTDPDQSHFTSRHYWEVGATQADLQSGWLGRYLDIAGTPENPLQGLCLDEALQPALATTRVPVATIDKPSAYSFYARDVWGPPQEIMYDYFDRLGRIGAGSNDVEMTRSGSAALMSSTLRRQLEPFQSEQASALPSGYPSSTDDFPARARGLADRVITLVWSEFGRRAQENASAGTDHGAAGCGFVIGTRAAGTMIGEWPGLAGGLDELGNVRATADFRSLYCSLIEQWLGHEAAPIIPGAAGFGRLKVIR